MALAEPQTQSPLVRLPFELRNRIWTILYTDLTPPYIRWHDDDATESERSQVESHIATAPAFICKYLFPEVHDTIWRHVRLHLTRRAGSQTHHTTWPSQIHRIRHVTWYFSRHTDDPLIPWGLPAAPVPLWLFPQLETFTIRFPKGEDIEFLDVGSKACGLRGASQDLYFGWIEEAVSDYLEMEQEERIAEWDRMGYLNGGELITEVLCPPRPDRDALPWEMRVTEGGRRRWLHYLLDPGSYGSASLEKEFEDWDERTGCGLIERYDQPTTQLKEIAKRVRVFLEVELWIQECKRGGGVIEPVVAKLNCETQDIVQVGELSAEIVQQGLIARWMP